MRVFQHPSGAATQENEGASGRSEHVNVTPIPSRAATNMNVDRLMYWWGGEWLAESCELSLV